jgi:hypothetical protein
MCVLDNRVTSNHVHLVVKDRGRGEISKGMQLIAGRTAQNSTSARAVSALSGKTATTQPRSKATNTCIAASPTST